MENKIAVASLASLLAQSTGKSKKLCEDFLREFFRLTAETLENGETLKIKGFGTFKIADVESRSSVNVNTGEPHEIAPHKKVVFTPAKDIASAINAPFEEFESVEMEDDMPDDILIEPESQVEKEPEKLVGVAEKFDETAEKFYQDPTEKIEETPQLEENPVMQEESPVILGAIDDKISDEDNVSADRLEEGSKEEGEDDDITYEAYRDIEETHEQKAAMPVAYNLEETEQPIMHEPPVQPVKSRFGIGFLTGALTTFAVCAVIFMLGCFFDWWPVNFGNPKDMTAQQNVAVNEVQGPEQSVEAPATPEKEPVYDTVSTTRYLTTIAREHYGNYNFWPYIYLENESILGHPDRITPGTKVVVPELSKYGVDPKNKDDVAQAKKKAVEIYARFK